MFRERYKNLNIYNPVKSKKFSGSYVIAPQNPDHDKLGHLYIVVELALENTLASKITEIIVEVLQKEYYRLEEYFREEMVLSNFEKALNKTNQALSTLASEGYTDWINNTHIAIAVIKNNKIHFAITGDPKIFLVRGNNFITINQETGGKVPSPMKTFTNITSGTLMSDDNLFLTTPELMQFTSEDKVKKLILNNKDEVIEYLKHEIPMTDEHSFAALSIIIEKDDLSSKFSPEVKKESDQKDFNYPSLGNIDETLNQSNHHQSVTPNTATAKENTREAKINRSYFKKIKSFGSTILSSINKKDSSKNSNLRNNPRKVKTLKVNIKSLPKTLMLKFKDLPNSSKILLIMSVTLSVLFVGSLIVLKQRKNEINKLSQHEILLNSALEKEKEAQDALIYKDKDKAKELLNEAQEEANALIKDDVLVTEANNLLKKINDQIDKVDGVTRINDPIIVADTNEMNIDSIFGFNENIYSFDKSKNLIYSFDEASKQAEAISEESSNIGYFLKGAINDTSNSIIFLTDSPSFTEFEFGTTSLDNLEIDVFNYEDETIDIKTYSDRLYRLIPSRNQILKHTRTIAGYSKGVEWALSNTDELEDAVSFTIDGYVYVLRKNGEIIKYLRGIKQEFSLQAIQNPMESPTKIFTSDNLENIYIIEPEKKRVLVFNKNNGALTIQFTSNKFEGMQDVYVDDNEQKLYILTKENVFGIVLDISED